MKRFIRIAVPILLFVYPKPMDFQTEFPEDAPCRLCILQQDGSLLNIIHRTVTGNYAEDANLTFGHCFVCIHCPDAQEPACYGWWPADPDGGDYEGDEGSLHPDAKEAWHCADCVGIDIDTADRLVSHLDQYEAKHRYQVLNQNGTSCIGFCEEMAIIAGQTPILPYGYLSIAGDFSIRGPSLKVRNTDGSSTTEFMEIVQRGSYPLSVGYWWNKQGRIAPPSP